jgi:hypothetical protein
MVLAWPAAAGTSRPSSGSSAGFETSRVFELRAGPTSTTFTLRERGGVILVNRLTVPVGVRVLVDARIPGLAGARVTSWPGRDDPSFSCRRRGLREVCTQGEEWCPMPQATWYFRLVKLSGPAGPVRFEYVVGTPRSQN